jgi:adenine-specific DNA-methyltransferase
VFGEPDTVIHISRPFAKPKHGPFCLKVINHFGDEVQKVFFV